MPVIWLGVAPDGFWIMLLEASLSKEPPKGVELQAKVHVDPSEALDLFKLLVDRKICSWIRDDAILRVGSQQVLSGMFAVGGRVLFLLMEVKFKGLS